MWEKTLMKMCEKGFTTKELLMVVVVMGILCIAAIPQFYSMQRAKRESDVKRVVALIQAGLKKLGGAETKYPKVLDNQEPGKACVKCFATVFEKPFESALWFKESDSHYYFSLDGDHDSPASFREKGDLEIRYDSVSGTMTVTSISE